MNTIYSILQHNPLGLAILGLLAALILWRLIKLMVRVAAIVALVLAGYMAYRFLTGIPMLPARGMGNQRQTTASRADDLASQPIERPEQKDEKLLAENRHEVFDGLLTCARRR